MLFRTGLDWAEIAANAEAHLLAGESAGASACRWSISSRGRSIRI